MSDAAYFQRMARAYQETAAAASSDAIDLAGQVQAMKRRNVELEAALKEAIGWITDRSSDESVFVARLARTLDHITSP